MSKPVRWNFGNVLEWSVADRCILAASIVLVFTTSYAFAVYYYLLHPGLVDYADHAFVERVFRVQMVVFVGGWLAIVFLALILRQVAAQTTILPHLDRKSVG